MKKTLKIQLLEEYNSIIKPTEKSLRRGDFVRKYGYSIPTQKALDTIKSYSPIIEIGAGHGYWASLLRKISTDIIAYDNFSWFEKKILLKDRLFTEVQKGDYRKIPKHPERTLFICWPPPESDMACDCIKTYKGLFFIFIGEKKGGCTANENFYNYLYTEFIMIKKLEIPCWPDFFDFMAVYKRKNILQIQ